MSRASTTAGNQSRRLSIRLAREIMAGTPEHMGLIQSTLGFRTGTNSIKPVHIMNDLAQCVLGGAPAHGGDFLCRLIREWKEEEPNSEEDLRHDPAFGDAFRRAYPQVLGHRQITNLRRAAGVILNADLGMYKPGDSMASGLATHRDLLGFEGFRRFRTGRYLANILGDEGRRLVAKLYLSTNDPVSRALRPVLVEADLVDKQSASGRMPPLTPFDTSLGRGLTRLLSQPLSKPTLLRYFAMGATLGIVLKVLGAGRTNGRPSILAVPEQEEGEAMPLRKQAVQSMTVAISALDAHLASLLPSHPLAEQLWGTSVEAGEAALEIGRGSNLAACAEQVIAALRAAKGKTKDKADEDDQEKEKDKDNYWPDSFAAALGKQSGFIDGGGYGWGRRFVLSGEMTEVLVLMSVSAGERVDWRSLWTGVRDHLGLVVGAQAHVDAQVLESAGVLHVSFEELSRSSEVLLERAIRRGVARHLPDSGAQVGGDLS
jgi:hypothetical protein